MILVKKASWDVSRFIGVILYWTSLVSMLSFASPLRTAFFDIHLKLITLVGKTSAFLFLLFIFLSSLYLTLRISYRNLLSKARQSLPSLRDVQVSLQSREDE
jgi:hypothetical protein